MHRVRHALEAPKTYIFSKVIEQICFLPEIFPFVFPFFPFFVRNPQNYGGFPQTPAKSALGVSPCSDLQKAVCTRLFFNLHILEFGILKPVSHPPTFTQFSQCRFERLAIHRGDSRVQTVLKPTLAVSKPLVHKGFSSIFMPFLDICLGK